MNQSVIFTDQVYPETNQVKFIAQQQGVNINCYASFSVISELCDKQVVSGSNVVCLFEQCRFDLEDQAEALIEQEAFNDSGDIILA
ncbi:DUF1488 domain-containing protein [Shewanella frigidimarina]|uniref:DUF1488 domain-containing protein n=1 Tax=Shewanella frigidimarina TaxID=56812 RepID=UPI000F50AFAE|nr:DUF1488 domain-containing protein [Shewanella frigidimarina]RPA35801.1 DUF1488 domain-containing protein [Shewanella frigidimarina]|tara:strand:- start:369 stop:626 length:258 start_codon:yes stop_codon:yes gene_type:complete